MSAQSHQSNLFAAQRNATGRLSLTSLALDIFFLDWFWRDNALVCQLLMLAARNLNRVAARRMQSIDKNATRREGIVAVEGVVAGHHNSMTAASQYVNFLLTSSVLWSVRDSFLHFVSYLAADSSPFREL